MNRALTIGYSPCPNDTFIFYALAHGLISRDRISFAPPVHADVETLNLWAMEGKLDVSKLSFHALGHVLDRYVLLSAGAALGRGCGPLLVAGPGRRPDIATCTIAIPGAYTTAAMLLRLYAPGISRLRVLPFDRIMGAVVKGEVDCGVIIHEGRFTYQEQGLCCLQDLGRWWEEETGLPIPLGCIAARKEFPVSVLADIEGAIRESLLWARSNPEGGMAYIRTNAQEMNSAVLRDHISLYVNDFSLEIGEEGRAAVTELLRRGRAAGIFPATEAEPWLRT
ncbi:MAG: 1,4-dihydroxy-6-naphthoate synthase [Thermodesulfobacteriota bacterium]